MTSDLFFKKDMIICIESFHPTALDTVLTEVQDQLLSRRINNRIVQFPSQGPFGHQIRVVDDERVDMHEIPFHLLQMVDRMDLFLNPINGLAKNRKSNEILILTESQFKESILTKDIEIQNWVIEINNNIPVAAHLFWLNKEDESILQHPLFPPTTQLPITPTTLSETASRIVDFIVNEVGNG